MGDERKTGTITLTVPYHEDHIRRADGALWDGRDRTGAAKDGRSIAVLHADIGKALLASWPGEPEDMGDAAVTADPLTASLPLLNIEAHGATAQELAEDLVDQLRFVWRTYGCADVDTLTQDARRLRDAARALFAADAAKPESEDMSEGADFTPDPPRFTGSKEATIAKLAEVDPALAADVARANGVDTKG